MLYQYYNKVKQLLQNDTHELDVTSNDHFIRIDNNIKKWDNEQWKEVIFNVGYQYVDKQQVLYQIKNYFDPQLRTYLYPWIVLPHTPLPYDYKQFAEYPCSQDNIIFRDIDRTHSNLDFFKSKRKSAKNSKKTIHRLSQQMDSVKSVIDEKMLNDCFSLNQKRLFYLLRAYANQDPAIGYVQGMNYIMGLLLYLLNDEQQSLYEIEMKAYQVFLHINIRLNWAQIYNKSMKKLKAMLSHLQELMKNQLPEIYKILTNLDQPFIFFMDQYFFGLMSYKTPIEFSSKVLDIFLMEGEKIIFDILIRIFTLNKTTILSIHDKDDQTAFIKDILPISIEKFGIQFIIPNSEIII